MSVRGLGVLSVMKKTRNQPEVNWSSLRYLSSTSSAMTMRGICVDKRFRGAEYDRED
jgi:hypothetical protein